MRNILNTALVAVLAAALVGGCSKDEKQRSRPRPKSESSSASSTSSQNESAAEAMPPGHPPTEEPALPPGHPPISTPQNEPAAAQIESGPVSVAGLTLTPPDGWIAEQPANSMRAAQFMLPGDAGGASLVVYYFGVGQGGGAAANVERWIGQFKNPDDPSKPAESTTNVTERDGLKITSVSANGTYSATPMGPMAPKEPAQANQSLLGYIIEGAPGGSVFVKVTGPTATVDAQTKATEDFIASAKKS